MKNLYITWSKSDEIGIPIIDEQHRGAVATINSLFYFIQDGRGLEAIMPTINVLEQYTKMHFETEETIIRQKGYIALDEHIKLHKELIEKMGHITRESIAQNDPKVLLSFLKDWWMNHIHEEDMQYAIFVDPIS